MSKRRDDDLVQTFTAPADATVEAILNEETRRRDEMQLSPVERKLVIEQRRKDADRQAKAKAKAKRTNRVTLVLPPDLVQRLDAVANWQGVTGSQVATFLLYEAMDQYDTGKISFDGHKHTSYNFRYDWELIHPMDADRNQHRSEKKQKNGWG